MWYDVGMCTPGSGEGARRSKRATRKWYQKQERGLRFRSAGAKLLVELRLADWLRWVFVDLDRHEPGCRWRKLLARLD